MSALESGIYAGQVWHKRFLPTEHAFSYAINLFWIKLAELPQLDAIKGFNINSKGWLEFRRSDYCSPDTEDLNRAVLNKMNSLHAGEHTIDGDVYFLGQTRTLNLYFSPVNFYFVKLNGNFTYMLAEVSNTPWNERHYYLVDVAAPQDTPKVFHVSPFNPMDMTYRWAITPPADTCSVQLDCVRSDKEFSAGFTLHRREFCAHEIARAKKQIPSMTLKTVIGIYWQAVLLFIKKTPFYGHPGRDFHNKNAAESEK